MEIVEEARACLEQRPYLAIVAGFAIMLIGFAALRRIRRRRARLKPQQDQKHHNRYFAEWSAKDVNELPVFSQRASQLADEQLRISAGLREVYQEGQAVEFRRTRPRPAVTPMEAEGDDAERDLAQEDCNFHEDLKQRAAEQGFRVSTMMWGRIDGAEVPVEEDANGEFSDEGSSSVDVDINFGDSTTAEAPPPVDGGLALTVSQHDSPDDGQMEDGVN